MLYQQQRKFEDAKTIVEQGLAEFPDSHVMRKHGAERAHEVSVAARSLESDFKACENPATFAARLGSLDRELKTGGVNPGTSADLTVASVLALLLGSGR